MKICTALLGHPVQNNLFALIKKIFLQNPQKYSSIPRNEMSKPWFIILDVEVEPDPVILAP